MGANCCQEPSASSFRLTQGSTKAEWNAVQFSELCDNIYRNVECQDAYIFEEAAILGCGFIVSVNGVFVSETRYLATDMERRVANSFRNAPVYFDDDCCWIIAGNASSSGNYWHWFAQILPAIAHSVELLRSIGENNYKIVFPPLRKWQAESLDLISYTIGVERVELNVFETAFAKRVVYSPLMGARVPYANNRYRQNIRHEIIDRCGSFSSGFDRIVISRRDTGKRRILNEAELHEALAERGFFVFTGSSLGFHDQVSISNTAKIIVSPHGAGGANCLFCQSGATYIELMQQSYVNGGPISLAKTSGINVIVDFFQDDGRGEKTDGWFVDIDSVLKTLDMIGDAQ
ncbi:MAG: glycosyltransferase family 61 protein [Methylacidiphilales bacterium]|nr:glycosyltransferase family 61 protein [Candidatus Methylacidiphilales bacterium]